MQPSPSTLGALAEPEDHVQNAVTAQAARRPPGLVADCGEGGAGRVGGPDAGPAPGLLANTVVDRQRCFSPLSPAPQDLQAAQPLPFGPQGAMDAVDPHMDPAPIPASGGLAQSS